MPVPSAASRDRHLLGDRLTATQDRQDTGSDSCGPVSRRIAMVTKIAVAMPAIHPASIGNPAARSQAAATRLFHRLP